ncbi:helicase-related protein [Acetobacter sacchari]|nr:helicase-related protein [Acetobacter sacchari]
MTGSHGGRVPGLTARISENGSPPARNGAASPAFAARMASRQSDYAGPPPPHAILGPTNTGKTHYAIERMLAHPSGVIGFPLRLLARENYDRMVAAKGAARVGLITGEEKIVPPGARWFSCTVEAMPTDRSVSFLAVDEIQLCGDPERGHVFTSRLLHARGRDETLFLGSETIAPLLRQLVPDATIETRPRLSALTATGATRLEKLPPRTAIVAFSAAEIYAIAELIRSRRGGCAVVMGQMSPRTRNAQVALYQDREVDYLVATDAIGMGLNMDIGHVAFAGLSKFDGLRRRNLLAPEVAQIAGRAGRGARDGTFGTTGQCPAIPDAIIESVETHRFDPLQRLYWRNIDLDFGSPGALLRSLSRPSPARGLQASPQTSDALTLAALAADPEIAASAATGGRTRLLWDVCQIPDFRKLGEQNHTQLCARIYDRLASGKRLPGSLLEEQLARLNNIEGDVDTLMQRLAGIRIWSYVATRETWVSHAPLWQERTRAVEDAVSDALHERLTARFVDRRAAHLIRLLDGDDRTPLLSAVRKDGEVVVEGHAVGRIHGFELHLDKNLPETDRATLGRAARRAMRTELPARVAACCNAPDSSFSLDEQRGEILWDGAVIVRLRSGRDPLHPALETRGDGLLDSQQKDRIKTRAGAFLHAHIERDLAPLFRATDAAASDPTMRGVVHQLTEGLGQARPTQPLRQRGRLSRLGIAALEGAGSLDALYLPQLLKPRRMRLRALLLAIHDNAPPPELPPDSAVVVPANQFPHRLLTKLGWPELGPVRMRLDAAQRLANRLAALTQDGPVAAPANILQVSGLRRECLGDALLAIGFKIAPPPPLPAGMFGPSPALILSRRKQPRRVEPKRASARPNAVKDGPFAALSSLLGAGSGL